MALDRPVLITGNPRAGKSCVWRMLQKSSEFHPLDEPLMLWDAGLPTGSDDRRSAEMATEGVKQQILQNCEHAIRASGKARYLDNLAYHALRLPFVEAVVPDARVIHVIRDPSDALPELLYGWTSNASLRRAVVNRHRNLRVRRLPRMALQFFKNYAGSRLRGRKETYGPRVPGLTKFAATHSPAEVAAYQWSMMVQIALDDIARLKDLSVLEVRYDLLTSEPRAEALRIAQFVGIKDAETVAELASSTIRSDYVHHEHIERKLSEEGWRLVQPIISPLRSRLGYGT